MKKFIKQFTVTAIIAAMSTSIMSPFSALAEDAALVDNTDSFILGDVNGNGTVEVDDAIMIFKDNAGIEKLDSTQKFPPM